MPSIIETKICAVCGKEFIVTPYWAYKLPLRKNGSTNMLFFCSWTCYRKKQKEIAERKKTKKKKVKEGVFGLYDSADRLGIRAEDLREMIEKGYIPAKKTNTRWKIKESDLSVYERVVSSCYRQGYTKKAAGAYLLCYAQQARLRAARH